MFEKDELNLSLKSLQEEHNKILQQNEVSVYQTQRGLVLLFIEFQKLFFHSGFPKMFALREVWDLKLGLASGIFKGSMSRPLSGTPVG